MAIEQNKEIARRLFYELWIKGDLSCVEELIAPEYALHNPLLPSTRDGLKQAVVLIREAFPSYRGDIHDIIADDERAMVRWTRHCIHRGEFMGVEPTS